MEQISLLMTDLAPEVTKQCTAALEQRGIRVTVCEKDGRKALAAIEKQRPNAVLLDAFMPGLDAISVKQRCDEKGIQNVLFFVTGSFTDDVLESDDAGRLFVLFSETVRCLRHGCARDGGFGPGPGQPPGG